MRKGVYLYTATPVTPGFKPVQEGSGHDSLVVTLEGKGHTDSSVGSSSASSGCVYVVDTMSPIHVGKLSQNGENLGLFN